MTCTGGTNHSNAAAVAADAAAASWMKFPVGSV